MPLHAKADDTVYTKVDVNPVPVKTPPPDYPLSMKRAGVSGVVAVSAIIDEKGAVMSATVAKSSHADFENSAVEAVKKWKFKPAQKDGAPVKMKVTVPIRFNLEE
ncbi:MAG: energy transducer TonB [Verrucomicrobia bacterium]|nr:energy transducer TonB [Verrucomicrobiota bacterium]